MPECTPEHAPEHALRSLHVFTYDTAAYPFAQHVASLIGCHVDELSHVHQVETLQRGNQGNGSAPRGHHRWTQAVNWSRGDGPGGLTELLERFVAEVVAPQLGSAAVYYQVKPSLRVQAPGAHGIKFHTDREYHHQAGELNLWVPLTPTFDTNTLQLESQPERGDFAPLNLTYGQCARFWGNACRHGTLTNEEESARVSFDFRVVREEDFLPDPEVGRNKEGEQRYRAGAYYRRTEAAAPTALPL